MLCLGIESSCDETGLALVENGRVMASELASQADLHAVYGGVVPEIASREHVRALPVLWDKMFDASGLTPEAVEAVAVTRGPGLLGSLLVGLGFAKGLALALNRPLVGVDHLLAHLMAAGLQRELIYPFLGLVVSGGHTSIFRADSPFFFSVLGRTLDDAAGEAFDKTAKCLNLPYPGGQLIDQLASLSTSEKRLFPRPYIDNQNLDFSFSGLKTAVANYVAAHPELVPEQRMATIDPDGVHPGIFELCSSFNWAVADTLRIKLQRALQRHADIGMLVVSGGVAANSAVRTMARSLSKEHGLELAIPDPELCSDNGTMIAYYGEILASAGLYHGLDLDAVPRGRKVPWDYSQKHDHSPMSHGYF